MTLNDLYDLAAAEPMPDWWLEHLDLYRKRYPKRTAAQYFGGLTNMRQAGYAFENLLAWPGGYDSWRSFTTRAEIFGMFVLSSELSTAQLAAALARAYEEA